MDKIKQLLSLCMSYTDDPKQYHPEQNLYHHISIVVARASLLIGDNSVTTAAILHDLLKPSEGRHHAKAMYSLMQSDDSIRYFIHLMGASFDTTSRIVLHHMDKCVTNKNKSVPFIDKFFLIDDMINRYDSGVTKVVCYKELPDGSFTGKDSLISFVGFSPIQIYGGCKEFTVTVNRTPYTYSVDKVDWVLRSALGWIDF